MRLVMFQKDKEILFEFVKNDEIAVEIVNKIIPINDELLLKSIIKRFTTYKEIDDLEEQYLNDILNEIKVYEKYPIIKRVNSRIYFFRDDNQLTEITDYEPENKELNKVVACFNYKIIKVYPFKIFFRGNIRFLYSLHKNLLSVEVK